MRNSTEKKIQELTEYYNINKLRFILLGGVTQLSSINILSSGLYRDRRDSILRVDEAEDVFDDLVDHVEDRYLSSIHIDAIFELKELEERCFDSFYLGVEMMYKFILASIIFGVCFLLVPIVDFIVNGIHTVYRLDNYIGTFCVIFIIYCFLICFGILFHEKIKNSILKFGGE